MQRTPWVRPAVVLDADKRGDIASTAEAYTQSAFENLGVDCITLSPYLGKDSIEPFIKDKKKAMSCYAKHGIPVQVTCRI